MNHIDVVQVPGYEPMTLQTLVALVVLRDEQIQWDADNLGYRPDRSRCCWPECSSSHTRDYGLIPMCQVHAMLVARHVNEIDARISREVASLKQTIRLQAEELASLRVVHPLTEGDAPRVRPIGPKVIDGTVYFLQDGGHIKIGWTSNMAKRMRNYSPNCVLLATHPGTRKDELRLHKMFAVHRSHGKEWYPLVPVILDHIKRVIAEHGTPDPARFCAKPTQIPQPRQKQYIGGDRIGSGSTPRIMRG